MGLIQPSELFETMKLKSLYLITVYVCIKTTIKMLEYIHGQHTSLFFFSKCL